MQRRTILKELAEVSACRWAHAPVPLPGETRLESRNTIYQLRDGVCVSVTRRQGEWREDPSVLIGMRVLGWLPRDNPESGLTRAWRPGAYAVLGKADDRGRGPTYAVALTSPTTSCETRTSVPPPLPRRAITMTRILAATIAH